MSAFVRLVTKGGPGSGIRGHVTEREPKDQSNKPVGNAGKIGSILSGDKEEVTFGKFDEVHLRQFANKDGTKDITAYWKHPSPLQQGAAVHFPKDVSSEEVARTINQMVSTSGPLWEGDVKRQQEYYARPEVQRAQSNYTSASPVFARRKSL
jgi:hypothetical protein